MLTSAQFRAYCRRLDLRPEAIAHLTQVRTSPPTRSPQSHVGNVLVSFPSQKMGCVIKGESKNVEYAFLLEAEYSNDVLEFYDQPPSIQLEYLSKKGKPVRPWHTPDFFRICQSEAGWEECKPHARLVALAREQPERYCLDEQGRWRCPPGEAYAAQYGLYYRVRSSQEINWNAQANWHYLQDYYRHAERLRVTPVIRDSALDFVEAHPGATLATLRAELPNLSADDLNTLIVTGLLFVDLNSYRLEEPARTPVFLSHAEAQAWRHTHNTLVSELSTDRLNTSLAEPLTQDTASQQDISTAFSPVAQTHAVPLTRGALIDWDGATLRIIHIGVTEIVLEPATLRQSPYGNTDADPSHRHAGGTNTGTSLDHADDTLPLTLPRAAFDLLVRSGKIIGTSPTRQRGITQVGRDRLAQASEAAQAEATRRAEILQRAKRERLSDVALSALTHTPPRTLRAWREQWRVGEAEYGSGYIGLLPQHHACGRKAQLPYHVAALIQQVLSEYYDTTTHRLKRGAYGEFLLRCDQQGVTPPSERTFYAHAARHLPAYDQELSRSGPRGAYRNKDFTRPPEDGHARVGGGNRSHAKGLARHGAFAWAQAHMDHTEIDLELISDDTGAHLGRAWLTLLIDDATRMILAYSLSFDPPSYVACMLTFRECVRRHGRLPQAVVVDGGKEFHSIYFDTLLARYEVTKIQRPPHEPRFGSVIERLFGTLNTTFLYHLLGNTQLTHRKRQVTKSTDPKTAACWTLSALVERLDVWAYSVYETKQHASLGQSPREAYVRSLERHGARSHLLIPYDQDFVLSTFATTRSGLARVQPGRGIQVNYLYYWCDAMRDPAVEGQSVALRYDPLDITSAYAYIRKRWRKCLVAFASEFAGCSERELKLLTMELRKRKQLAHNRKTVEITQRELAEFRRGNQQSERVLQQRVRDRALRATQTRTQTRTQTTTHRGAQLGVRLTPRVAAEMTDAPSARAGSAFPLDADMAPLAPGGFNQWADNARDVNDWRDSADTTDVNDTSDTVIDGRNASTGVSVSSPSGLSASMLAPQLTRAGDTYQAPQPTGATGSAFPAAALDDSAARDIDDWQRESDDQDDDQCEAQSDDDQGDIDEFQLLERYL